MLSLRRALIISIGALTAAAVLPARAEAQWYAGAYLGANYTQPANVSIDQPSRDTSLTFSDVHFAAEPWTSPQYYGWRVGRFFGASRRWGIELEYTHLKVIAKTDESYAVSGTLDGAPIGPDIGPMNTIVDRYRMTHGLNFYVGNLIVREPLRWSRATFVGRAGAGITVPHAETTIRGEGREQYEYGGPGMNLSAGVDVRLTRLLSAVADYKFTFAKPEIDIVDGVGRTRSATHQVTIGLAIGMPH
ncbi:MAG TPA: outer membrane beta-barrel protein [Vicinamibacterales bacterium]|nr:outer membrane beta-barrel protein [Vicinamibacterales bacterium]